MPVTINSGEIVPDVLYVVIGSSGTITYNSIAYNIGDTFRGILGVNTFSSTGTCLVEEVTEIRGFFILFEENQIDLISTFPEITILQGFGIELDLNNDEKIVNDTTIIQGFGIELLDYPFYVFFVNETRL